ncbi:MAG: NAD-binding protein [Actinobacteria bacterium]|nr:NAD-binding protein [Actinomycetota bacterium]
MQVLIIGGGVVGGYLAQILGDRNEVTVVDSDHDKCDALSLYLKNIKTVCEDGCEPWVLEHAGVRESDLVLAVTGDDEDNLVIARLSKYEYDAAKVIARVNNPKNGWLFTRSWGVDVAVNGPEIMANVIEEETTLGEVVTLMKLQSGDVGLLEITLPDDSPALGKPLSELELPPETLIVSIIREETMLIPKAETVFQNGDKVVAITHFDNKDRLEKIMGHTTGRE